MDTPPYIWDPSIAPTLIYVTYTYLAAEATYTYPAAEEAEAAAEPCTPALTPLPLLTIRSARSVSLPEGVLLLMLTNCTAPTRIRCWACCSRVEDQNAVREPKVHEP